MAAAYIFILHVIGVVYAFVSRKKTGGISEGFLAVAFIGIVFAVGWTISTMLTNLLFTPEFFIKWYYHQTDSMFLRILRKEISRDTISILILTFGEIVFYYFFLRGDSGEQGAEASRENKEAGKGE